MNLQLDLTLPEEDPTPLGTTILSTFLAMKRGENGDAESARRPPSRAKSNDKFTSN